MRYYFAVWCDLGGVMTSPACWSQPRCWKRRALAGSNKAHKVIDLLSSVKRKWGIGTLKLDTCVGAPARKRQSRDLRDSWVTAPRLHRALWFDVMDVGLRLHWHPRVLEDFILTTLGKSWAARERVICSELIVCKGDQLWRRWRPCCNHRPATVDLE